MGEIINVALPKGRLGEAAYGIMEKAGYRCPGVLAPARKLFFESPESGVRYFWVKPSDVPVYVERGAADAGIAGLDILREHQPEVYELVDLGIGRCRMCVAGPSDFADDESRPLKVATKFPLIKLNGSIELAPLLGLSDVIVDLVETGRTLRENNLEVLEEILPISARFISNKASYKFHYEALRRMTDRLARLCAGGNGEEQDR